MNSLQHKKIYLEEYIDWCFHKVREETLFLLGLFQLHPQDACLNDWLTRLFCDSSLQTINFFRQIGLESIDIQKLALT